MRRIMLLLLVGALWGQPLYAQAKLQPLLKRIALLQVYLGYVKKGYHVVQGGLRLVGDVKNGEFTLHRDYLGSWARVSPVIRRGQLTLHCIQLQQQLVRQCAQLVQQAERVAASEDRAAVLQTVGVVLNELYRSVEQLNDWISPAQRAATDAQRLTGVARIYEDMSNLQQFLGNYQTEWQLLQAQRRRALQAVESIRVHTSTK